MRHDYDRRIMRWLADLLYLIVGLLYAPIALYQIAIQGKNRRGWRERFGAVPRFDPQRPRIWIHAVSLGEINATPRLVDALKHALPDHDIVVSTTTDTGYARGVALYGRDRVFRFPLDFSLVVQRALRRIRPAMIVLMELEVWYNLTRTASRRGIPVVVVNGRLTERSARRLGWLGPLVRPMFRALSWVGAQDEAIADRFRELGVQPDCVEVTSSLKWDSAAVSDRVDGADALAAAMGIRSDRPLWVCGSTGPGEEELLLDAYAHLRQAPGHVAQGVQGKSAETDEIAARAILAIVPRKPERFDEVARLIERRGFACVRRRQCPDGKVWAAIPEDDRAVVLLGDTMGELRKFYSLAVVVFVARSLVPMGGSDPMEVAALGKPIIVGPHMENFAAPVEALTQAGAIRSVRSAEELSAAVSELVTNKNRARELGARARGVVLRRQGATRRTVVRLVALLGRPELRRVAPSPETDAGVA